MIKADLHVHSTISDGEHGVGQIIEIAWRKGLDAIAITDHDTIAPVMAPEAGEGAELANQAQILAIAGLWVIVGIEISAIHKETNTIAHVLGYRIKKPEIVTALTTPLLEARNRNSEKQAQILIENGFQIDIDRLPRADGKYLYKQHILDWLVGTGQAPDMFGAFYRETFKNGGICDFDIEYIDVFKAVRAIKEAGGLVVLAHPGQQQNFWLIPQLAETGLDGLELNHHAHGEKDRAAIRGLADQYRLFMTGGSDFHGKYSTNPYAIGDVLSDESGVRAILHDTPDN